ncbi:MAG: hypothetical protein ACUVTX_06120 [Bacteroidales bacterium]
MQKFFFLILTVLSTTACNKVHDSILWEKSFGQGEAFFAAPAGDTAIICGGIISQKPYIVCLGKDYNKLFEYNPDVTGSFTSAITENDCIITAGCTDGNLFIASLDYSGVPLWDTVVTSSFNIEKVSLCKTEAQTYLAVASRSADSISAGNYGLLYVFIDNSGTILNNKDSLFYSFFAVSGVAVDNAGYIYLAVSRQSSGNKMKASVLKCDSKLRKVWEQELYNNPEYSASSMAVTLDNTGDVFVSGYAEFPVAAGTKRNAFTAALSQIGVVQWKKYLEYNNEAPSLIFDRTEKLFVLNAGCMILNLINPADGTINGILRTYASCDPSYDNAKGNSVADGYENILVIAGTKNGSFYVAAKSPDVLSPV